MSKKEVSLYAAPTDWPDVLQLIERTTKLVYVEAGLFDDPNIRKRSSFTEIPGLGLALSGDRNLEPFFLVGSMDAEIRIRNVPQRNGTMKYAIDQISNPQTVVFRPAGLYADQCIIAGQIGTVSPELNSLELYQLFLQSVRARFCRVKGFWVGKDAAVLMDSGTRLTTSVRSPECYDLRRG